MLHLFSVLPFNRTILELKLIIEAITKIAFFTFNRTILELKPGGIIEGAKTKGAFNRTILELKHPDAA